MDVFKIGWFWIEIEQRWHLGSDAIAATDGRVAARRDSALEKLRQTMDTGKASAQAANSWRFSFSLEPGEIEGTVTVLFEKVK